MEKILVIYFRYPLYPSGSYFQEFLGGLSEFVKKLYLIASHYPKGAFHRPKNMEIFWAPYLTLRLVEDLVFMFAALARVIFCKALHEVDVTNAIGPRGLLAGWYLKKFYGIPLVCTVEMLNEGRSWIDRLHHRVVRFMMSKIPVDRYICWSRHYWENHLKAWGIPEHKVEIIPGGVNTRAYHPQVDGSEVKRRYAPDNPLIVFAKPLYYPNSESAKLLVRSLALLKPKMKVKLLVGSGWGKREVEELATELGVSDQVAFMSWTPFPEIPKYIAAADLIVLPFTYAATTSRSLFEAMALAKPIVTTPMGEVLHMIKDGEEALLVRPKAEEIAGAIERLLSDRDLARSLGERALALVQSRFSLDVVVERNLRLFSRLSKARNGDSPS